MYHRSRERASSPGYEVAGAYSPAIAWLEVGSKNERDRFPFPSGKGQGDRSPLKYHLPPKTLPAARGSQETQ